MRCDVNISVRRSGSGKLGTRTEIKNLNSFKAIARAIEYESERHIEALETGCETIIQETRRFDDGKGETFSMRGKEDATDYRYFPNPELMPVCISDEWIEAVRATLPETAQDKFTRLTKELNLPEYDAKIITGSRNLSVIFDETMQRFHNPKEIANWIIVELLSIAKGDNKGEDDIVIDEKKFATLMKLCENKTINRNVAKKILIKVFEEGVDPERYVEEHKLGMVTDAAFLENIVRDVLLENEKSVLEYKNGNQKVIGFFVGKIMNKSQGKADPKIVNELLRKLLDD